MSTPRENLVLKIQKEKQGELNLLTNKFDSEHVLSKRYGVIVKEPGVYQTTFKTFQKLKSF